MIHIKVQLPSYLPLSLFSNRAKQARFLKALEPQLLAEITFKRTGQQVTDLLQLFQTWLQKRVSGSSLGLRSRPSLLIGLILNVIKQVVTAILLETNILLTVGFLPKALASILELGILATIRHLPPIESVSSSLRTGLPSALGRQ
jgi:hypothetical protein